MYIREHNPPHFHAFYQGQVAAFSIETGQMIQGDFPHKKAALVTAWAIEPTPLKFFVEFFGLFWPIFDSKVEGYIPLRYCPPLLNRKSAQKNRKID
jgi:hypothetical protein